MFEVSSLTTCFGQKSKCQNKMRNLRTCYVNFYDYIRDIHCMQCKNCTLHVVDVNMNSASCVGDHFLIAVSFISIGISWNSGKCKTNIGVSS